MSHLYTVVDQVTEVALDIMLNNRHFLKNLFASELQNTCPSGTKAFLDSVEALCRHSRNEWYRVYLIRKIGSQCGVKFVSKLLRVDAMQWLFPGEILLKVHFLLHHSTIASTRGQG